MIHAIHKVPENTMYCQKIHGPHYWLSIFGSTLSYLVVYLFVEQKYTHMVIFTKKLSENVLYVTPISKELCMKDLQQLQGILKHTIDFTILYSIFYQFEIKSNLICIVIILFFSEFLWNVPTQVILTKYIRQRNVA